MITSINQSLNININNCLNKFKIKRFDANNTDSLKLIKNNPKVAFCSTLDSSEKPFQFVAADTFIRVSPDILQKSTADSGLAALEYLRTKPYFNYLFISQHSPLLKTMAAEDQHSVNIRMLIGLVDRDIVPFDVLNNITKHGKMNESVVKDLQLLNRCHEEGIKPADVFVPKIASEAELKKNIKIGDVFEIEGVENVCIKTKEDGFEYLKVDKEMYMKLFPPVERFALVQSGIGDCYLVSTLDALYENPKTRHIVLSAFEQQGNDVLVKFPKGESVYLSQNCELPENSNRNNFLAGAKGFQLLEHVFGLDLIKKYNDLYYIKMKQKMGDMRREVAIIEEKRDKDNSQVFDEDSYQYLLYQLHHYKKAFNDFKNKIEAESLVLAMEDSLNLTWGDSGIQYKPAYEIKNLNGIRGRYTQEEYYRNQGGDAVEVFNKFGLKESARYYFDDELDSYTIQSIMDESAEYSNFIIIGSTKRDLKDFPDSYEYGIENSHAYFVNPEKLPSGKTLYNIVNPYNTSHKITIPLSKLKDYFLCFQCSRLD